MGLRPTPETKNCSKTTRTRNVRLRKRNTSRKAARKASVEARRLVPSDCAVWVRSWHTKDGDIMSEMSFSMRAPSVVPRYAVAVGYLKVCRGGTAVGETREEGGSIIILSYTFLAKSTKSTSLPQRRDFSTRESSIIVPALAMVEPV